MSKRPCLVVGASGSIGEAVGIRLLQVGRRLALTHSVGSAPSSRVSPNENSVKWYEVDVRDSLQVSKLIKTIEQDFNAVPDLVYCAGVVTDGSISLTGDAQWNEAIQTNLTGAFYFIRALSIPLMAAGDGRIVMIGSVAAKKGNPGQISYSAAKAGLEAMCRVTAAELGRFGVTCNVVSPGAIESRMVRAVPKPIIQRLITNTPLRRLGKPSDVAGVVNFLLSDDGAYITGQVVQADGGMTAT